MNNSLHGRIPGRNIEYHDIIDSTNIRAKQLGAAGAPHMTLVLANEQTAGRGRMTRSWVSPPGTSALMSLLVRPKLPAWRAPELVFISAVAACDAVNALTGGEHARIKWPNDLVIGTEFDTQSGDLRQTTRHERRFGVVPHTQAVTNTGGKSDHVFQCAAEFHTDDITACIDAKCGVHEKFLHAFRRCCIA